MQSNLQNHSSSYHMNNMGTTDSMAVPTNEANDPNYSFADTIKEINELLFTSMATNDHTFTTNMTPQYTGSSSQYTGHQTQHFLVQQFPPNPPTLRPSQQSVQYVMDDNYLWPPHEPLPLFSTHWSSQPRPRPPPPPAQVLEIWAGSSLQPQSSVSHIAPQWAQPANDMQTLMSSQVKRTVQPMVTQVPNTTTIDARSHSQHPSVGTSMPNAVPMARPTEPTDADRRRGVVERLALILHSTKCLQKDAQNERRTPCGLLLCPLMKDVLKHMVSCTDYIDCTETHCLSSRKIISHWKSCKNNSCVFCKPFKQVPNQTTDNTRQQSTREEEEVDDYPTSPQMPRLSPQTTPAPSPALSVASVSPPTQRVNYDSNMLSTPAPTVQPITVSPLTQRVNYDSNMQSTPAPTEQPITGYSDPLQLQLPEAQMGAHREALKDWHQMVTPEERGYCVRRLCDVIITDGFSRFPRLREYVQQMESHTYGTVNCREQYYQTLVRKAKDTRDRFIQSHPEYYESKNQTKVNDNMNQSK